MNDRSSNFMYRGMYLMGSIITFTSLFIDWFHRRISDVTGQFLVESIFRPFQGWQTYDYAFTGAFEEWYPAGLFLPLELIILEVFMLILSVVMVIFRANSEKMNPHKQYEGLFLLATSFMTLITPNYALVSGFLHGDVYFPFLTIINDEIGISITSGVSIGYIMHITSFVLLYPFAWFHLKRNQIFETKSLEHHSSLVRASNHPSLDQLLAEEVARLHGENAKASPSATREIEQTLHKYQKRRVP